MVYLPPNYYINTGKRYPVLYMHDGNNVFDRSKATYGNEWNADETAEKLIKDGKIEEIIIVGIFNNSDRFREYTPYPSGKYPGGKLRDYADFIINDLKPIIDRKFRTRSDAKNTAIAGSSLGGVASFYLAWWYPEVFSMAGVISPTLWWADNAMFRDIESYSGSKKDLKIWIDMGKGEADCDPDKTGQWDPIKMCYELESYLEKKGYKEGVDVTVYIDKDAVHNEASWSKRFDKFLIFMFGK